MFTDADVIYTYTRKQAIADGVLVDCMNGFVHPGTILRKLTMQHFTWPAVMTMTLYELLNRLVEDKRNCNDWRGVWHDVCWMLKCKMKRTPGYDKPRALPYDVLFELEITTEGKQQLYTLKANFGFDDDGKPCLTFMFPNED